MIDALHNAASGLRSEQKQIDVISNNVANMNTPGFKRGRVNFVDVATLTGVAPGDAVGNADASFESVGNGTRVHSTTTVFSPGEMRATRNPLDVAIDGAGFLEFQADDGALVYSRDGQLRLDAEGQLVNVQGQRLARSIHVPADAADLRIAPNGDVSAVLGGGTERTVLGTLELATFATTEGLLAIGDNRFAATDAAGAPTYGRPGDPGMGVLQAGFVEMANVNMVEEMTSLVLAQRAYQLNARVLQASDQLLETINNLRR